ncbi:MAG: hypothetical protein P4L59_07435 [Desulfosporosinus sp.]|nr:hypothetical protein [Desulfosporosinus sp.]
MKTTAIALSLFVFDHFVLIGESYTNTILRRDTVDRDRDTMGNNEASLLKLLTQNQEQGGEIRNQTKDQLLLPFVYNEESIFRK